MDDFTISGPLYCSRCGFALGLVIVMDGRTAFQDRKGGPIVRRGIITCARCGEVREFNSVPAGRIERER